MAAAVRPVVAATVTTTTTTSKGLPTPGPDQHQLRLASLQHLLPSLSPRATSSHQLRYLTTLPQSSSQALTALTRCPPPSATAPPTHRGSLTPCTSPRVPRVPTLARLLPPPLSGSCEPRSHTAQPPPPPPSNCLNRCHPCPTPPTALPRPLQLLLRVTWSYTTTCAYSPVSSSVRVLLSPGLARGSTLMTWRAARGGGETGVQGDS